MELGRISAETLLGTAWREGAVLRVLVSGKTRVTRASSCTVCLLSATSRLTRCQSCLLLVCTFPILFRFPMPRRLFAHTQSLAAG